MRLSQLARFFLDRKVGITPRPRLKRLPWSAMWQKRQEQRVHAEQLAAKGRRLATLQEDAGWQDLLELKSYCQTSWDATTKMLEATDQQRFQAAAQWAALEHFFLEISHVIRLGSEAERKLRGNVEKIP